jgi:hypothetical protein
MGCRTGQALRLVSFILSLWLARVAPAQELPADPYGPDPLLFNGKLYAYFLPGSIDGHQFLRHAEFATGSVVIRGVLFAGVQLNYDIINDAVLFRFIDASGAVRIIELSDAWLEQFCLDGQCFQMTGAEGSAREIYQVIGDGEVRLLRKWTKSIKLDNAPGSVRQYITPPVMEQFVLFRGRLTKFTGNRGFLACFPPEDQEGIKSFMRQEGIGVKFSSDEALSRLMDFCNSR